MVPGEVLVEWVGGAKFITRPGDAGITGNVYAGLHDFADMGYVLHATTEADLFIDVGANVGAYTILACAARGARGYCFEPVPSTYARLIQNLKINDLLDRVIAMNIGVSKTAGTLTFSSDINCGNHVLGERESKDNSLTIPVRTLDAVLTNDSPSILKIDVEGFEKAVLDGAKETLAKPSLNAIIIEVNGPDEKYGFDPEALLKTLKENQFSAYRYDPFARLITPLQRPNVGGNTLFLRDARKMQEKLSQADPFQLAELTV